MSNNVIILTAPKQVGKTSLLQTFCRSRSGFAGLLTPIVNGSRMFYAIVSDTFFEMEAVGNEATLMIGKFTFSEAAFKKADTILLEDSNRNDILFLIIDEIGPLEMQFQQGFYQTLVQILQKNFPCQLLLVVRPQLVDAVKIMVEGYHKKVDVLDITAMKKMFESF